MYCISAGAIGVTIMALMTVVNTFSIISRSSPHYRSRIFSNWLSRSCTRALVTSEASSPEEVIELPPQNHDLTLNSRNLHPLDPRVTFDAANHRYQFDGQPMAMSVTELVSSYFSSFNSQDVAERMISGKKWPREGYIHENGFAYTVPEILNKWNQISRQARIRGSWMHYYIECFLNDVPLNSYSNLPVWTEKNSFLAFKQEVLEARQIETFRTEWRIAAPDLSLAGSIDFVGRLNSSDQFIVMDWKRSRRFSSFGKPSYFRKYGRPPLKHLEDCDRSKYFLQLNLYRYILRSYYDLPVEEMLLVAFPPGEQGYIMLEVPKMEEEVLAVVADIKSRRKAS